MAVSFDLFGTLVTLERTSNPADRIAAELTARDIPVPDEWRAAYRTAHLDAPPGVEIPLPAHVDAALTANGITANSADIRQAVTAAFEPDVALRDHAQTALAAANETGPVGVLSNCSVPGLVPHVLTLADCQDALAGIVSSVDCGYRKPDPRAFHAIATELGVDRSELIHIGDDPETDGAADAAGATAILLENVPLDELPSHLQRECPS